jgi:hypothetical protein
MSLVDLRLDSPSHRLRSSSGQHRPFADDQLYSASPDLSSATWTQWTHHGMSPEMEHSSHPFAHDPFDQLMENNFTDHFAGQGSSSNSSDPDLAPFHPGLGLDMEVDLGGTMEEELFEVDEDGSGSIKGRARTRLQSRTSKSQVSSRARQIPAGRGVNFS